MHPRHLRLRKIAELLADIHTNFSLSDKAKVIQYHTMFLISQKVSAEDSVKLEGKSDIDSESDKLDFADLDSVLANPPDVNILIQKCYWKCMLQLRLPPSLGESPDIDAAVIHSYLLVPPIFSKLCNRIRHIIEFIALAWQSVLQSGTWALKMHDRKMTDQLLQRLENDGPSWAGLDFDGLCHNADGAGKVQCTVFAVGSTWLYSGASMSSIFTTSATYALECTRLRAVHQKFCVKYSSLCDQATLRWHEWTTRVVLVCMWNLWNLWNTVASRAGAAHVNDDSARTLATSGAASTTSPTTTPGSGAGAASQPTTDCCDVCVIASRCGIALVPCGYVMALIFVCGHLV